ncbi:hypothetical protein Acr_02g0014270 [Actinidia rufa]|uniref:Uncharacterized protein n=1 Tax=Actinidia rufa TaxID=165716 RepID=A0A7J0EC10_9ERIC|nr:hypothetical protein Acr_02g0014270 [Actinidia rufa]
MSPASEPKRASVRGSFAVNLSSARFMNLSFSITCQSIATLSPHQAERLRQVRLPPMRIREWVAQRRTTSLKELSEVLSENTRIIQALDLNDQASTLFGSFDLSSSSREVEVGEEVNKGEVAYPEASTLFGSFDLSSSSREVEVGEEVNKGEVAYPEGDSACTLLPYEAPEFWSPEFVDAELGAKDLAAEDQKIAANLLIMQHMHRVMANRDRIYKHSFELKKAQKKANTTESELKKAKAAMAYKVKKREASYDLAAKSLIEIDAAKANMNAALLKELNTSAKHPAWNVVAPEVEVPDPPEPYSPILLLDFNEEEYANQPAEDGADGRGIRDFEEAKKLRDEIETSGAGGEDQDIPPEV